MFYANNYGHRKVLKPCLHPASVLTLTLMLRRLTLIYISVSINIDAWNASHTNSQASALTPTLGVNRPLE